MELIWHPHPHRHPMGVKPAGTRTRGSYCHSYPDPRPWQVHTQRRQVFLAGKTQALLILRVRLERRNFTGIMQEFYRNQFNFTEKTQKREIFSASDKQTLKFAAASSDNANEPPFNFCSWDWDDAKEPFQPLIYYSPQAWRLDQGGK